MRHVRNRWVGITAFMLAFGLLISSGLQVVAQDAATPVVDDPAMAEAVARPAHIHTGTCDNVGEVIVPLADVNFRSPATMDDMDQATPDAMDDMNGTPAAMDDMDGTPMPMDTMGSQNAIEAAVSVTVVELSLDDILAGEHLINVHMSAEQIEVYIACGEIGGSPDAEGGLYLGLRELNDSGFSGIAWLRDNGDETTTVTLFLAHNLHAGDVMPGTDMDMDDMDMDDDTEMVDDEVDVDDDATPAA